MSEAVRGCDAGEQWTPELVEQRLLEAGRTLMALEVRGLAPAGIRTHWPDVVHSYAESYGWAGELTRPAKPNARQISAMDEALAWIVLIPPEMANVRRVVGLRALVNPQTDRRLFSHRRIAEFLRCSHVTVKQWHSKGLGLISQALAEKSTFQTVQKNA